jgi:WD40 repeat protein
LRPAIAGLADNGLPSGVLARLGSGRFWHGRSINQVAYTADGKTLASVSYDGVLRFWDVETGLERRHLGGGAQRINSIMFTPEGRAVVREDRGPIRLYDVETLREIHQIKVDFPPTCLALSADGKVLATGGTGGRPIRLWDVATGRILREFEGDRSVTLQLGLSPDGRLLISVGSDSPPPKRPTGRRDEIEWSLRVRDVTTGVVKHRIELGTVSSGQIAFTPDGTAFIAGLTDNTIRLWDAASGAERRRFGAGDKPFGDLTFSPDGKSLAWSEAMPSEPRIQVNSIHLVDTASGRELWRCETHTGGIYGLAFSPDGMILASSGENVVRLWHAPTGSEIRPNPGHLSRIGGVVVTPDGKTVITGGQDGTIRFWDSKEGEERRRVERPEEPLRFLALSADGKTLVSGGEFHPARLWDVATGREIRHFQVPGKRYAEDFGDLSPDGKTLVAADESELIFWDTATGKDLTGKAMDDMIAGNTSLPYSARKKTAKGKALPWISRPRINALRFAPDGRSLATITGDWVRIWDPAAAREIRRFQLPNASESRIDEMNMIGAQVAFSPDGRMIAASNQRDGIIFLLDAASGKELGRVEGSEDMIKTLAFSPDGRILATQFSVGLVGRGGPPMIRLWDIAGRKELRRIEAHRGPITALAFSPDGSRLISASEDGTALIWDVRVLSGPG